MLSKFVLGLLLVTSAALATGPARVSKNMSNEELIEALADHVAHPRCRIDTKNPDYPFLFDLVAGEGNNATLYFIEITDADTLSKKIIYLRQNPTPHGDEIEADDSFFGVGWTITGLMKRVTENGIKGIKINITTDDDVTAEETCFKESTRDNKSLTQEQIF